VLIRITHTDASFIVYNAKTNTSKTLAPMQQPQAYYGMAMVNTEDVLLCGGGQNQQVCSLYIGQLNMWNVNMPQIPSSNGLIGFPMLTLYKRPYVFGGYGNFNGAVNTVYTFETGVWSSRANMTQAIAWHTAVAFDTDTALVCGGKKSNDLTTAQTACNTYKAATNAWTKSADMTAPRWGHGMTMYKGHLYDYYKS
jgi:N-acetylneuraminic acid mutarotase